MLKFKRFSMFSLISAVLLFMLILPALANEGDVGSCTISSDGVQTCISDPVDTIGSGEGSEPGNPGEDPVEPVPVDPVEEIPVVEKPSEEVPVVIEKPEEVPSGEEKPAEEAPDAVVDEDGVVVDKEEIKNTDINAEDLIIDDGIRYFVTTELASIGSQFAVNADGMVVGASMIASLAGLTLLAFRNKKK